MNLEEEVYELLKKHFPNHVRKKQKFKGFSGFVWTPDFVMEKDGLVVAIIECKQIDSKSSQQTFHTQMRLAFAELSDLHRKYNESISLVILPEPSYDFYRVEKYQCLFDSLKGAIVTPQALTDSTLEEWLQEEAHDPESYQRRKSK